MDIYKYICPKCGFLYQVPEYWASFAPEEIMEQPHIDLKTGEFCSCTELVLDKSEEKE